MGHTGADRGAIQERRGPARGALSNPTGRFERLQREAFHDGWEAEADGRALAPVPTSVRDEAVRSVISRNSSPDVPFDRAINPYRGCEHGCIYCFARPTHGYLGLSTGVDFETKLTAKLGVAAALAGELGRRGYVPRPITLGASTDAYQPLERQRGITREVLEVLARHRHPVVIVTKGNLVLRDLDLLAPMAAQGLVRVAVSVTTLRPELARAMEPRAATPARRLVALAGLRDAGVPTAVLCAPVIPALNDAEMEAILERGRAAGAAGASYTLLRLPWEIRDLFAEWLAAHVPERAAHVLSAMRQCRGGALYDARFGTRLRGEGPLAALLAQRFRLACARLGLGDQATPALRCDLFAPPAPPPRGGQLPLFTAPAETAAGGRRPPRPAAGPATGT